jgi:hypothetical protein
MPLATTQRKVKLLEVQLWQHIDACQSAALHQLTDDELEQFAAMFAAHPELNQLSIHHVPTMPRPAKLPPVDWALMQRFATLFMHAYRGDKAL